jgi:mannitol/fructose-specific phosphotransferase system IIA component (Ntr-type)
MKLVHLILPERVFLNLEAKNLNEAIRALVPLVVPEKPAESKGCLICDVIEREGLASTMIGRGFAIPHARSEEVDELTIGVGVFPNGLEDKTPDGLPVSVVFLILEPKRITEFALKVLAGLAKMGNISNILQKLSASQNPEQFLAIIGETKTEITEKLVASDIAVFTEPILITKTLKQVADIFFKNKGIYTIPVVDGADYVLGVVRCSDLLQAAIPEYARMIGPLPFLSDFEPFDHFLTDENTLKVHSVMSEDYPEVEENASIIEVMTLLLHRKENALVLTRKGLYRGMVSLRDIITKVVRT